MWRTSRQVRLLCPRAKHLTGRPHLYVEDRWPSFPSEEKDWWQERHPTVKTKMPCYKNADYLLWQPLIGKKPKEEEILFLLSITILLEADLSPEAKFGGYCGALSFI